MKLHPSIQALIDEIDAFRFDHGMPETAFGLAAVKDGKFIADLRNGRMPSLTTMDRVRAFMRRRQKVSA